MTGFSLMSDTAGSRVLDSLKLFQAVGKLNKKGVGIAQPGQHKCRHKSFGGKKLLIKDLYGEFWKKL